MKIAYLDCFAGISGDMFLGALLDLGVDPEALRQDLSRLAIQGFTVNTRKVTRCGISATKVEIKVTEEQPHRHLSDILNLLEHSRLAEEVKQQAGHIFIQLAAAEGKIHGCPPEKVHFHEVGAVDSIIDIVGTLICLKKLGISEIYCSPLNVGSGTVHCAHGIMPVPAPATAEILLHVPIYTAGPAVELVTPTGAVLAKCLAKGFGPMPAMILKGVGYGAGDRETEIPNLLRIMVGEPESRQFLFPWPGEEGVHGHRHHHCHCQGEQN
ncbi:nickel pincer cofactor biosynthesis protein LarC [Desulforamulus hydrothermalis]|uniref:LarC family nickel insertion protein n=1 Tax=Desulforamulus hydrothermalis Lam5 = DSM 18033 TaxID=1121428 RepID=K8EJ94_9FIRM|nr:nickel pincer cofactor biosynthesis protein LarC [Desulforamulus hydrothermalis]CCO08666.1 conserved hypothetical protein [Desulforamulus hydrothermalis Lam5 = DSM 18033]SHH39018.1 hypothetical protein SAMN02745177_02393 [Desulforamulus hydrothermalis Lam5 = DSM 18033]